MNITDEIFYNGDSNSSPAVSENGHVDISHMAMNIICVVLGFPTNIYAIWLIVTGAGNGLAGEFFTLNLSACELLFCLRILLQLIKSKCQIPWEILAFLDELTLTGRPQFQSLICVERYLAVVHPVTFLKYKPLRYKVICCVIAWVASSVFSGITIMSSLLFLAFPSYWIYMARFLLFFSIQLFFCLAVLRALKQSGPGERGREEENHMKRRAFHLIVVTTLSMVVIYAPYTALLILTVVGKIVEVLYKIVYFCLLTGILVHPLLFLCRIGKLRFIRCL